MPKNSDNTNNNFNFLLYRSEDEEVVISVLEIPTRHGAIQGKEQYHKVKFYNLDAIISVGYRINSRRATQKMLGGRDGEE